MEHWIPDYIRDQINELNGIQKAVSLLLQVSQTNNILLARINRLPGVPVSMKIQFPGSPVGQPGQETDIETIRATAVELDSFDNPTAIDVTNLEWFVSDSTVVSLTQNVDGSGSFQAIKPGSTQVKVKDTQVGLTALSTLNVVLSKANTIYIQFGVPK